MEQMTQADSRRERRIRKPIRRSVLTGFLMFFAILSIALLVISYLFISASLYSRYESKMANVITYVEHSVDADDLRTCIETGQRSEKYEQLQAMLNVIVDDFELDYLYIPIPTETCIINACSATSAAERAAGETDLALLEVSDAYSPEECMRFLAYMDTTGINYFEETSDYGDYYTACKALRDSQGEAIALICADISVESIHRTIRSFMLISLLLFALILAVFGILALWWLRKRITDPILALEDSAYEYVEQVKVAGDTVLPSFDTSPIQTDNEVESLAETLGEMAVALQRYLLDMLDARRIANRDELTGVKNKHAYIDMEARLDQKIEDGEPVEFAIVMLDINGLKAVNDSRGHAAGDRYIQDACAVVCSVFRHSPVYRVGGDEFAVVIQNQDYSNLESLLQEIGAFNDRQRNEGDMTFAYGMAKYQGDRSVSLVLERADYNMYKMKKARNVGR